MPSLSDTQQIFWELITAPEGVRQGLAGLPDRESRLPGGLQGLIREDDRLSAVQRLDVYANMYFFRILDILKEDFPAVLAVVGNDRFHNLVTSYLLAHPSSHPSVRYLGRHLADFIDRNDPLRGWPWLSDLARLEWAILDAFDGPNAEALEPQRLQEMPPERWAAVRLRLAPTLQVLRVSAPVHRVWREVADEQPVSPIRAAPTTVRVWRKELRVLHRDIEASEVAAIDAVRAGENFAGLCEAIAAIAPEEAATTEAARILHTWFADGLVVGLD